MENNLDNNLLVTASPHILAKASTQKIMGNVIIALLPTVVASGLIFGARAIALVAITVAACVGFEFLYTMVMKKPSTVGDLSAVVTGILLAFNLPPTLPLYMAIIGAFVAIVIVKMLFGGLGFNFANPAIVARIVLAVSFTSAMTSYIFPANGIDALAGATPMAAELFGGNKTLFVLLLGNHGGVLGETCAITLILGGLYLIFTKTISAVIPVAYIGTVAVLSMIFGQNALMQILSGGLLLGAIFMATDYVTSPFTFNGRLIFGIGLGVITCGIRFFATSPEGVSFAILIMNLLVPYINDFTRQKVLGAKKRQKVLAEKKPKKVLAEKKPKKVRSGK
ncbi:MAG: RnfABCDGE type electron transport complex subunit D [Oscillospiraceae bacterium]